MGFFGPYIYKDKKTKIKWWLHSRQKGKTTIYFFSKDDTDAVQDLPGGYEVIMNERSGIPMLRKTSKRKDREKLDKEVSKG